jgi:signal transduction histidine kinase
MEAAGPEGEVRVTAAAMESGIRVEIRDSGAGIDPDDLERIWDPDFTTKSSGTGLGLPMALQTIRFHHGRIEARNHPEGGAVFLVELPVEWDLEAPSPEPAQAPA